MASQSLMTAIVRSLQMVVASLGDVQSHDLVLRVHASWIMGQCEEIATCELQCQDDSGAWIGLV
jgi:hypothetical protein